MKIHIVQPGETLESVAERYGISVEKLFEANGLNESDSLEAGMKVRIPTGRVPVTQQPPVAEPTGEPPKHRPEPPKKEPKPPKKEHRPPKKKYPHPSSSSWFSPDRSPWRESPQRWMSPEHWETPRRYPYSMEEQYPEPGYPRPETPRYPEQYPDYPDPRRPMIPPMLHPVYPWPPYCYPFIPFPMMPMPYPMMPGPYMYPPSNFPYREMESESIWDESRDSSWEGSVRTHEGDSSATDIWDSREN